MEIDWITFVIVFLCGVVGAGGYYVLKTLSLLIWIYAEACSLVRWQYRMSVNSPTRIKRSAWFILKLTFKRMLDVGMFTEERIGAAYWRGIGNWYIPGVNKEKE